MKLTFLPTKIFLILFVLFLAACNRNPDTQKEKHPAPQHSSEVVEIIKVIPERKDEVPDAPQLIFSSETSKIALGFFKWYWKAIKNGEKGEYQPVFVSDNNGMMDIDYSNYIDNLRYHHFSESLIKEEKNRIKTCAINLKEIKFKERQNALPDLEDYERIGCDFFNSYRWVMDMEPYEGSRIIKEELLGNSSLVQVQHYYYNKETKRYFFWDRITTISLAKKNNKWEIMDIQI